MHRITAAASSLAASAQRLLPESYTAWLRNRGTSATQLGTREQLMAIGGAALVVGWLGFASSMVGGTDSELAAKKVELARLEAQVASLKSNTQVLQGNVAAAAAKMEARQVFLAGLLGGKQDMQKLAAMLPQGGSAVETPSAMLEPFRKVETAQLAFVDKATDAARARLQDTQSLIRRLGLDPSRFVQQTDVAVGGPYIPVGTSAPADADPRFKSLFLSWKKLAALETAMSSIPAFMPVKSYSQTSTYGVRYDPFTGNTAMHAGLDMAGTYGEPVYAAAAGIVTVGGRSGAYGNLVELAHGKGMMTRYGHLSAVLVQPGATVKQGQLIGRMGSTGRSTGTHLHYEVRIDGKAVNPRPYLDASAFMLAAQGRGAREVEGPGAEMMLADDDTATYSITTAMSGTGGMTRIVRN